MKKGVKLLKNQYTGQMKDVKKYKIECKAAKKGGQSKVRQQMPDVFEVPQEKAIEPQENEKLVGKLVVSLILECLVFSIEIHIYLNEAIHKFVI